MDGFRHENKYFISWAGYQFLRGRLAAMLETDSHAVQSDGRYKIRSLYFDDYKQSGLLDKVEGVETREKFRIRFYDMDDSFIRLESKQKHNQMTKKQAAPLTREQTDRLLAGDLWFLYDTGDPLLKSFYLKSRTRLLRPCGLRPGGVFVRGCAHHVRSRFTYRQLWHRFVQPGLVHRARPAR